MLMMSERRSSISLKCYGEQFSGMMENKLHYKHFSIACRVLNTTRAMSMINRNPLSTTYSRCLTHKNIFLFFFKAAAQWRASNQFNNNFSLYYRFCCSIFYTLCRFFYIFFYILGIKEIFGFKRGVAAWFEINKYLWN